MSTISFYRRSAKYGSMDASLIMRFKGLEGEKCRSKKMYLEERLKWKLRKNSLKNIKYPDLMVDGALLTHQPDYAFSWLIDRPPS